MKSLWGMAIVVMILYGTRAQAQQTLIHYWSFNDVSTPNTLYSPTVSLVANASVEFSGSPAIPDTNSDFNNNLNARNASVASSHLRFNTPIDQSFTVSVPSTGYTDVVVKYATNRSGSGSDLQEIYYSVNGTDFTKLKDETINSGSAQLITIDLASIAEADNNPNLKIRITFKQGTGGTGGNNRIDNITADGTSTSPDSTPPGVSFEIQDLSSGIQIFAPLRIFFDEQIRLIDNTPIDNTNIGGVLELRLDNASGTTVPFTATIVENVATVTPSNFLSFNQSYYVAVKGNAIEDVNGNALVNGKSVTFSTTSPQTIFNPGDLVFVAYRANTSTVVDEFLLYTFVDIIGGTEIWVTDNKYTDNQQPQCAGGFMWIAPQGGLAAGSTIGFKPDVPSVNKGTHLGASFGLSSNGDQVIVYQGLPSYARYVTAMSTNAWVTNTVICDGSLSKIPAGLVDGQTSINLSTAPGNVSGNTVNAYYNGPITAASPGALRALILDPANWIGTTAGTAPQPWNVWPDGPKLDQTITFETLADKSVTDPAFPLTASSTSGLAVTFVSANDKVTIVGNQVTLVKPGKATIAAKQNGNGAYNAAPDVSRTFCVNPAKPVITITGAGTATPSLQSSAATGNQWLKNGDEIAGATAATLAVTTTGNYSVKTTVEECATLSNIYPVTVTGDLSWSNTELTLSPNPADDKLLIQLPGSGVKDLRILNSNGVEVLSSVSGNDHEVINLNYWSRGLYLVHVKTSTGSYLGKFIRR